MIYIYIIFANLVNIQWCTGREKKTFEGLIVFDESHKAKNASFGDNNAGSKVY